MLIAIDQQTNKLAVATAAFTPMAPLHQRLPQRPVTYGCAASGMYPDMGFIFCNAHAHMHLDIRPFETFATSKSKQCFRADRLSLQQRQRQIRLLTLLLGLSSVSDVLSTRSGSSGSHGPSSSACACFFHCCSAQAWE